MRCPAVWFEPCARSLAVALRLICEVLREWLALQRTEGGSDA